MAEKKYIGKPGKQDDPCWKGYQMVGMKKKGGRKVPNCVPESVEQIIEKAKKKSKKDWTGAKIDKDRFILPEEIDPDLEDELKKTRQTKQSVAKWAVKKGTQVVSTHATKDAADVKAMKHPLHKVVSMEEVELEEKRGLWDNIHAKRKRIKAGSGERMRKPGSEGAPTDAALKASQTEAANPAQQAAIAIAMKKAGKKPKNEEFQVEQLGRDNEWGRPELRKKFAKVTPGQETMEGDTIPTFDARYDNVTTQYCGGIHTEETLTEISAKGAAAREKFRARIQKVLADPKAIAKAKKTLAKKKEEEKKAPKNLVHQLHKAISVGSKVKFHDGKEHDIAPNHADKFMSKYHGLKSSIEKESLVKRAHKSHDEFMKAIHEEACDASMPMIGEPKPCTCDIEGPNYPTPPMNSDILDYNEDGREDEYDEVAIEADVANEIESSEWDDLSQYYDDDDLEEEDDEEELDEAITPQGRLKKKFNAMRTKTRRNMARNLALKRVATPDRIKARSIRAARNMVYKRILRGRDRSTISSTEKARIEAQVKRMAPTVARLSIRLQSKERQIDRSRATNRYKKKKK